MFQYSPHGPGMHVHLRCPTGMADGPGKRQGHRVPWRWLVAVALVAGLVAPRVNAQQWSEDPSDATTSLTSNVNDALAPAYPATCGGASLNGPFFMGNVTSATPQSANLAYAPCQAKQTVATPAPAKDMWFRMDPAFPDAVYRFTLLGTGSPAMTMGGMAVYEATSATASMRLLGCATGGGGTSGMPSVEAACLSAGSKIYIRVWDRNSPPLNSNFNICVRGQRSSTMPDRGADETPCTARVLAPTGFTTSSAKPPTIDFVYPCEEPGFLYSDADQVGGDLWVKLQVPSTGHVRFKASWSTSTANRIGSGSTVSQAVGVSAYLSPDCSDPSRFRQVGGTTDLVTPAASGIISDIRCLPPGEWLYLRIHPLAGGNAVVKRFGQMRLEWAAGGGSYAGYTPPAGTQPCGAIPLTVGATCTGNTVTGSTYDMCGAPGIPEPRCGGFTSGSRQSVWYKFTAPPSGMVVIDAKAGTAPATRPAIALYSSNAMEGDPGDGCRERLSILDCDDRQGPGNDACIVRGSLYPGRVYYVRVWAGNGYAEGNFSLCVSSPPPPPGTCWYLIDLWASSSTGTLAMEVTIPPGPTVTYTTSGGNPSEVFLIPLPVGATVDFHMMPAGGGIGASGYVFHALWQVGNSDTLWWDDGGYAVAGPTPGPSDHFTLTDACSPWTNPRTDCFGMRTICLNAAGTYHTVTGQMDNRRWPMNLYSPAATDYLGYTFHPHNGGMIDLAGANMGCLEGESDGIQWMVFRALDDGTVAFLIDSYRVVPPPSAQADMDFAIWDLGVPTYNLPPDPNHIDGYEVCPPASPPVRCSSARNTATTGLALGMMETQEGHGGWGWLAPLPVQTGHAYLIALVGGDVIGRINYSLHWTLYKDASGTTDPTIIGCDPLVLPVELLFLEGEQRDGVVDLAWATASEKNSSHFVVERSADAMAFTPIGRVKAGGDSQYRLDYGFTDEGPGMGINYYRLRQVDRDGKEDLSNTVAVFFKGDGGRMLAWPNPAGDRLHVDATVAGQLDIQIINALGQVVRKDEMEKASGVDRFELDTHGLPSGSYLLRLVERSGDEVGIVRFVKQ